MYDWRRLIQIHNGVMTLNKRLRGYNSQSRHRAGRQRPFLSILNSSRQKPHRYCREIGNGYCMLMMCNNASFQELPTAKLLFDLRESHRSPVREITNLYCNFASEPHGGSRVQGIQVIDCVLSSKNERLLRDETLSRPDRAVNSLPISSDWPTNEDRIIRHNFTRPRIEVRGDHARFASLGLEGNDSVFSQCKLSAENVLGKKVETISHAFVS